MDTTLPVLDSETAPILPEVNLKISAGDVLYFCGFYEEEEEEDHTQLQQENIMTNRMDDALKNQSIWPAILAPLMFLEPGTLL